MRHGFAALAFTLLVLAHPAIAAISAEGDVAAEPAMPVVPSGNVVAVPVTPEGPPAAAEGGDYVCTPGFALAESDGTLHLKGTIDTPTPGYSYDITDINQSEKGKVSGILRLTAPGGAVIQVISHLDINFDVPATPDEFTGLTLGLEKAFGWGISSIACSPAASGDIPPQ